MTACFPFSSVGLSEKYNISLYTVCFGSWVINDASSRGSGLEDRWGSAKETLVRCLFFAVSLSSTESDDLHFSYKNDGANTALRGKKLQGHCMPCLRLKYNVMQIYVICKWEIFNEERGSFQEGVLQVRSHLVPGHWCPSTILAGHLCEHTFFEVPALAFGHGSGARVQGLDLVRRH